ncbi:hypothetical protein Ddc_21107 [Ditylenchus destructor]|nr:hypothetical protein Ddc_21107 [Ditylenchus destructor]
MDNDTMVEVFKSLNYCQLAKNSIVSKRFCDLIQTHRHKLALLYVDLIETFRKELPTEGFIEVFDKELSPQEYNKWIIRNGYSKQVLLEGQVAGKRRTIYERKVYQLGAHADYNALNHRRADNRTTVFLACVVLNNKNWPLFQHFVRLITDPFIYIRYIEWDAKPDVLNLLAGALNPDYGRIQCRGLTMKFGGNAQEFINSMKDHVLCKEFHIWVEGGVNGCIWMKDGDSNYDKDVFKTGTHCASAINVADYRLSTVIANLVQKFMDLKNSDESQIVNSRQDSLQGQITYTIVDVLKRNYTKFLVKDEINENTRSTDQTFEFFIKKVGKKLQLTVTNSFGLWSCTSEILLKVNNL